MRAPSPEWESLGERQRRFAGHIRDPELIGCPPDAAASRMALYRELFLNNVIGVLGESLPLTRSHVGDVTWIRLATRFFAEHRSRTPYFHRLPGEFVHWLSRQSEPDLPEFLWELAHYEWSELELATGLFPVPPTDLHHDLLAGVPLLTPTARLLEYRHPVHRARVGAPIVVSGEPVRLLLWRDAEERVRLLELNPATARLLQLLAEASHCGHRLLARMAAELRGIDPAVVVNSGREMLDTLYRKGVVIGASAIGEERR